ncbi:MAG: hypothetical protein K2K13_05785 [Clostridiales bacterium]|nr:hypothetical protein [Clostridiales bacterium]
MADKKYEPGISVYTNSSGLNITWNREGGAHTSIHSNSQTTGKPVISEKIPDLAHYQRVYDESGNVVSETLRDENGNKIC